MDLLLPAQRPFFALRIRWTLRHGIWRGSLRTKEGGANISIPEAPFSEEELRKCRESWEEWFSKIERALKLYVETDRTAKDICEEVGVRVQSFSYWRKKRGIPSRPDPRHFTPQKKQAIIEAYEAREKVQDIASRLGISVSAVDETVRKAGIPRRLRKLHHYNHRHKERVEGLRRWRFQLTASHQTRLEYARRMLPGWQLCDDVWSLRILAYVSGISASTWRKWVESGAVDISWCYPRKAKA